MNREIKRAIRDTVIMAIVLVIYFVIALCVYAQDADALTLTYDAKSLDKPTVKYLYNQGCYANPHDKAERMYCPVKYRLFIYDDESGAYDFLYYTDEGKVRQQAAQALIKGWDVAEWEDV